MPLAVLLLRLQQGNHLDCLLKEARWYRDRVASAPVVQPHLGGGTPTFLNDSDLRRLVEGLR